MVAGDRPATLEPQQDFPTNRGGPVLEGLDGGDAARPSAAPAHAAGPRGSGRSDQRVPRRLLGRGARADRRRASRRPSRRTAATRVGCFGGGGLTNEKAYALGKFARVALRTAMIDYNGRFCMSSAATAANRAFGIDRGLPFPLVRHRRGRRHPAGRLESGRHHAAGHAVVRRRAGRDGATHIVVDPRRTATAGGSSAAPGAAARHRPRAGQRAAAPGDQGRARSTRTTSGPGPRGSPRSRRGSRLYWPDRVERITGDPGVEALRRHRARPWPTAERAMILTARGAEQHSNGTDTAQAYINLALALGLPGRPFSGYGTITGQGNGQGGREHGQKADQLPGYRKLADPADRAHVAAVWGIDPDELPQPGLSAFEMLDRMGTDGRRTRPAGAGLQHRGLRPGRRTGSGRPAARPGPAGGVRHLPVRDRRARRRRAAHAPSGPRRRAP